MKIKKSYISILLLGLFFIFSIGISQGLTVTLNVCPSSFSGGDVLDDKNVTGSNYCINATFADLPAGTDASGATNITQCTFTFIPISGDTTTIATNTTDLVNLSSVVGAENASRMGWDTSITTDTNITSVNVSCRINSSASDAPTIADGAINARIDNTIPTSTYSGETPRSGSTIDDDYVIIETATDRSIVNCMLVLNKTGDATSTFTYFKPRRNKCTTEAQTVTRGLTDDVTYGYHLRIDDGYNVSQSATRTFTTNIRTVNADEPEDDEGSVFSSDSFTGKRKVALVSLIIILFVLLVGGSFAWYNSKK